MLGAISARPEQTQSLSFQSVEFDVVDRDGQRWLRLPQIGVALGYKNPHKVQQVFERNAAEFTDSMTAVVTLPTAGGEQQVRIFSLRGAHLLGMLSRTRKAAEFRRWVLDVLEHERTEGGVVIADYEARELTALLIHLKSAQSAWRVVMPALQAVNSPLTRYQDAFSHASLYADALYAILARRQARGISVGAGGGIEVI